MKRILFFLMLSIIFVVSSIIHIPLGFVARFIPEVPNLSLINPSGSIWRGKFHSVRFEGNNLGALSWEFNFWQLFAGNIDINFFLDGNQSLSAQGRAGVNFSGIYAKNTDITISSTLIDAYAKYPLPMTSRGRMVFRIDEYTYGKALCKTLTGKASWENAALDVASNTLELGQVLASFSCQSGSILARSSTRSSAMESEFALTLLSETRFDLKGNLTPKEALPAFFKGQLQWLGQPDSQGRYSIAFGS